VREKKKRLEKKVEGVRNKKGESQMRSPPVRDIPYPHAPQGRTKICNFQGLWMF